MILHTNLSATEVRAAIRQKKICFGGNRKLKTYGLLSCTSGKRMKRENRVFFSNEKDALLHHYHPCGHCMREAYKKWKHGLI